MKLNLSHIIIVAVSIGMLRCSNSAEFNSDSKIKNAAQNAEASQSTPDQTKSKNPIELQVKANNQTYTYHSKDTTNSDKPREEELTIGETQDVVISWNTQGRTDCTLYSQDSSKVIANADELTFKPLAQDFVQIICGEDSIFVSLNSSVSSLPGVKTELQTDDDEQELMVPQISADFATKPEVSEEVKSEVVEEVKSQLMVENFTPELSKVKATAVDYIIALDVSGSMKGEMQLLQNSLPNFLQNLAKDDLGGSLKITALARGLSEKPTIGGAPMDPNGILYISNTEVSSHDALAIINSYIQRNPCTPEKEADKDFKGCIREKSFKELLVITDDNSQWSKDTFFKQIASNPAFDISKLSLSGIIGLPTSKKGGGCEIAQVGSIYQQIHDSLDKKGLILDLCDTDWNKLLKQVAEAFYENHVSRIFTLQEKPDITQGVTVMLNDQPLNYADYLINNKELELKGTVKLKASDMIKVSYYPTY